MTESRRRSRAKMSVGLDAATGQGRSGVPTPASLPSILAADPVPAFGIQVTLDDAYAQALELIRRRRCAVQALAVALVEKRVSDGGEVAAVIARHFGHLKQTP